MSGLSVSHNNGSRYLKHLDSVKDPVDHFFLNQTGQFTSQRQWTKKVQQELAILEKNLADTIYVRVYEDRMDLLGAVIIGAAGMPYQDKLLRHMIDALRVIWKNEGTLDFYKGLHALAFTFFKANKFRKTALQNYSSRANSYAGVKCRVINPRRALKARNLPLFGAYVLKIQTLYLTSYVCAAGSLIRRLLNQMNAIHCACGFAHSSFN